MTAPPGNAFLRLVFASVLAAAILLPQELGSQESPSAEETLSLRHVSVIGVLASLTGQHVAVGVWKSGEPVSATSGRTRLHANAGTNALTLSGPADEVTRLKEQAARLDLKPVHIILSTAVGKWRLRQMGVPEDCAIARLPVANFDLAKAPVDRVGRMKPSAWILEIPSMREALSLLESTERIKVQSKPSVFTPDNVAAEFGLGSDVWVPRNNLWQLARFAVTVLPILQQNGEIVLEIDFAPVPQGPPVPFPARAQSRLPTLWTEPFKLTVTVPELRTVYLGGIVLEYPVPPRDAAMPWTLQSYRDMGEVEIPILIEPTLANSAETAPGGAER